MTRTLRIVGYDSDMTWEFPVDDVEYSLGEFGIIVRKRVNPRPPVVGDLIVAIPRERIRAVLEVEVPD